MKTKLKHNDSLIERLFFHMLPVQILIFAMGSVNSIVDGVMAGRFIDATSVGVIGLYYAMVNVLNAVGSVLLGGSEVLCGRFMGRGEKDKTEGIFSLDLTIAFLSGCLLTAISLVFPGALANILGANDALKGELISYIRGYAVGIIPMLLSQQIASFLQMERQSRRGYAGVAGMIISNIVLNIVLVAVLKMGVLGLALATSFSNIIYFLILAPYYLSSKAQLKYSIGKVLWGLTSELIRIGSPGALLVFCLALRGIALNRILLTWAGSDGLSAWAALTMVNGFFIAYCLGNGAIIRMLVSIFSGEEDKNSIKQVIHICCTKGILLSCIVAAIVVLASPVLSGVFFPDRSSTVYHMTLQLYIIYGSSIPLILICQAYTNFLQAMGHNLFVNIQSVFDGFISMVLPALILAPHFGALGVWLASPIGLILTILLVPIYRRIYLKRFPKSTDDYMFFRKDFGIAYDNTLSLSIQNIDDVVSTSESIQAFCNKHNIEKKKAYYAALCAEEMAANVVQHGFSHDDKPHSLTVRAVRRADDILLRFRDDCIPFNPQEMGEMVSDNDEGKNIGIRMVYKIADEVSYQNLLGLNVLTIVIKEHNLLSDLKTDYLLEKSLQNSDPDLHRRYRDAVFAVQRILSKYRLMFPEYTDHSELHSMTVIDSCNRLIGVEQISKLNKDEIYILLTASYLHDTGMGISENDFEEFMEKLDEKSYFENHPNDTKADFVRDYHNELSGLFIEKYTELLDIPSPEYTFAIKQVARGHRKTDMFDEKEYPSDYRLPNGNTVCLPFLASLLRVADEIDVVATRNPLLLYDLEWLTDETEILENKKLQAVKSMKMTSDAFILEAETDENEVYVSLTEMVKKMQKTLDYCRDVVDKRTDFKLTQERVILHMLQ